MRENPFLCRVYICNKRVEVESVLHLLFYILKKEKAKKDALGEGLPIYDGIYFCRYLFFVVIIKECSKKLPKYFFSESGN